MRGVDRSERQRVAFGYVGLERDPAGERFTRRTDYREDGFRRVTLVPCSGRGGRCGQTRATGIHQLTCTRCGAVRADSEEAR